ncbi:MAG: hypothetical protein C4560_01755 [Nitrospiraceae bacterium]|nr:MAG: hypothetical protein C4560_01755 [Nitrospiraceae bacterium]
MNNWLSIKKLFISSTGIFIGIFLLSSVSFAGWLIYYKPEFRGKVIGAETKEPIEGAVVVVVYKKHSLISGPGGGYTSVIKVKETLTDKNGEFYFSPYTTLIQPNSIEDYAEFIIYKPGYGSYPNYQVTPRGLNAVSEELFFSKGIGNTGELEALVQRKVELIRVTFGIVELPILKTWEDRNKANMISPTDDDNEWPLLHEMIKKEDQWLENNKVWRE